jgi:hypothetical protein
VSRDLRTVEAELLAREPIFHKPELGTTRADYAAQTADDYWEVGASGQVYDRESVIETLLSRGTVPGDQDGFDRPHVGRWGRTGVASCGHRAE